MMLITSNSGYIYIGLYICYKFQVKKFNAKINNKKNNLL
jgi:hypothetical protein